MAYSKKVEKRASESNVDWDEFNEHLLEQIGEESESQVAILSGIMDLGIQERPDHEEDYKGSTEQDKSISEGRSYLTEDETLIITPAKAVDSVALYADFPDVLVNYGKFFSKDEEDEWRPYRHLITNTWWDPVAKLMVAKGAALSCRPNPKAPSGWAFDPKSTISKLATCTGAVPKGPVDQEFELGDLLGGVFVMDLQAVRDKKYINVKALNIGTKHKAIPSPEYDLEPFGVSWKGGNDDSSLQQVRANIKSTMERALNWPDSKLKIEFEEYEKANKEAKADSSEGEPEETEEPIAEKTTKKAPPKKAVASGKKAPPKKAAPKKTPDPEPEEDEDCPFSDDE
jgi:hypothetical protein